MKKIISLFLAAVFTLMLCSCGITVETGPSDTDSQAPVNQNSSKLEFTSTDMDGKTVSLSDYSQAKVIMINMWETWCGPCVSEMPDLQKLYVKYKDSGFIILGATASHESEVKSMANDLGITYPLIKRTADLDRFETGYVPTTVFADGEGNILTSEPIIGGKSYSEWEKVIQSYLNA